jgi:hypothetical protein
MADLEQEPTLGSAKSGLRDAMKAVPSLVVLSALWFILLRYALDRWHLVSALSAVDRGSLASIFAVPLALITYFSGNYWDDRVFDPRYTEDPHRHFRGKWLDTSRRNCLGLLPAGRDLDQARKRAAADLKLSSVEGVYAAAKGRLQRTKEWATAGRLLLLSKLCRSLIWPSFLVATGLIGEAAHLTLTEGRVNGTSLFAALVAVGLGLLLFVPYVNLRVEHMLELYRHVSAARHGRRPS